MQLSTALAIYALIWGITLFAVLPFGVRSQAEEGEITPGSDPGAPVAPQLGRKLIWNTVISTAIFAGYYVAYTKRLATLDDLATLWGLLGSR